MPALPKPRQQLHHVIHHRDVTHGPIDLGEIVAAAFGVCPGNHESAGKRKRGKIVPANRYVHAVLCEMTHAAARTTSQFKSKFQGLVIRRGTKRAIVAIAHKLLKTVFILLRDNTPYRDSSVDYEALSIKRNVPRWIRQLKKHNLLPFSA